MTVVVGALVDRDVVRVTGADAEGYLQGQLSQDVVATSVGGWAWSLVLQPVGRIDAWLRLHRLAEHEFLLDLDAGFGPALVTRLDRFKLRTEVTIDPVAGWRMLMLRGAQARAVGVEAEIRVPSSWPGFEGIDALGPEVVVPPDVADDPESVELMRIEAGVPRMGAELTEATIPADAGSVLVDASVSFTKGCYTGQELVARINSRGGRGPRPLRLLVAEGTEPLGPGTTVDHEGAVVGEVTSAAVDGLGGRALALAPVMRRVESGAVVTVGERAAVLSEPGPRRAG